MNLPRCYRLLASMFSLALFACGGASASGEPNPMGEGPLSDDTAVAAQPLSYPSFEEVWESCPGRVETYEIPGLEDELPKGVHLYTCRVECGGPKGEACAPNAYCRLPEGTCGSSAPRGSCEFLPTACSREYDPVCGCDGQTYATACVAATHGVSVQKQGECAAPVR